MATLGMVYLRQRLDGLLLDLPTNHSCVKFILLGWLRQEVQLNWTGNFHCELTKLVLQSSTIHIAIWQRQWIECTALYWNGEEDRCFFDGVMYFQVYMQLKIGTMYRVKFARMYVKTYKQYRTEFEMNNAHIKI